MCQNEKFTYPKIHHRSDDRLEVVLYFKGKRIRLQNGKMFGIDKKPNSFPPKERILQAKILASQIYLKLLEGFDPLNSHRLKKENYIKTDIDFLELAIQRKIDSGISYHYKKQLIYSLNTLKKEITNEEISTNSVTRTLSRYTNGTSYNTIRRGLSVLFNTANDLGWKKNPLEGIKARRSKAILNKPIKDVLVLFQEIKSFNSNLYLCCLLTYGCLLRPHREIRELKWSDFTDDSRYISLSGERNKSSRNRVVPVPKYIRDILIPGDPSKNIFSNNIEPYSQDYFKGVWRRFKSRSGLLEPNQTLYSLRHIGAINIYKKTGSVEKLRKAMGHSNLYITLTYLRGLEVAELVEDDMPRLY